MFFVESIPRRPQPWDSPRLADGWGLARELPRHAHAVAGVFRVGRTSRPRASALGTTAISATNDSPSTTARIFLIIGSDLRGRKRLNPLVTRAHCTKARCLRIDHRRGRFRQPAIVRNSSTPQNLRSGSRCRRVNRSRDCGLQQPDRVKVSPSSPLRFTILPRRQS